jgi:hypothetical protein
MAVKLSALRADPLYHHEDSCYSFLLDAKSTPVPYWAYGFMNSYR